MKNGREILVIADQVLFRLLGGYFHGFKPVRSNIISDIENASFWAPKDATEKDNALKQVVCYSLIINQPKNVLLYRRTIPNDRDTLEELQNDWSIGINGHIYPDSDHSTRGIITSFAQTKIERRLELDGFIEGTSFLGVINCDRRSTDGFEKIHLGILFLVQTTATFAQPRTKDTAVSSFVPLSNATTIIHKGSSDAWAKLCLPILTSF